MGGTWGRALVAAKLLNNIPIALSTIFVFRKYVMDGLIRAKSALDEGRHALPYVMADATKSAGLFSLKGGPSRDPT